MQNNTNKKLNNYIEILDSFLDSIAIIDTEGEILATNKAWKQFSLNNSGTLVTTDIGVNYLGICRSSKLTEEDSALIVHDGILKVIERTSVVFEYEYPCHSPNEKRWFLLRATPVEGSREWTIVSHVNITQRKLFEIRIAQQNAALQKLNEDLKATTYRIVHDVQAPLNSIKGLIGHVKLKGNFIEPSEIFEIIEANVIKLGNFVQETLHTSMIKENRLPVNINLNKLLKEVVDSFSHMDSMERITVEQIVTQEMPFINFEDDIHSVLSNIISNAIKYCDPQKKELLIEINISVNATEAIITIADNGLGISPENLDYIFDMNFKVNQSTDGVGLGLYMVKKTIDKLNGKMKAESGLGTGTRFTLTIPNIPVV